ncbi:MAG: hypothetical protein ACOX6N_03270 [Patescibacteria group bacterium]|jgi:F0F1-type ATP synthase assembly protein I
MDGQRMKNRNPKYDMGTWIALGLSFGTMFGLLLDSLPLGLSFGLLIGVIIGSLRDKK